MKKSFPGYVRPESDDFERLWKDARVIVDANVLLNAYGYSTETRNKLFSILEAIADKLWMPHQFAFEFLRNRPGVIIKQSRNIGRVIRDLRKILDQDFRSQTTQPFVDDAVVTSFDSLCSQLEDTRSQVEALIKNDPDLTRILSLFEGKIGRESSNLSELYDEARERYAQKIPPGYADEKEKGEPECFGDYIGWKQILDLSSSDNSDAILVTDDAKEDWWYIFEGRTIGPRPELMSEFARLCGSSIYLYSSSSFVKWASVHLSIETSQAVFEELSAATQARIAEQMPLKAIPDNPDSEPPKSMHKSAISSGISTADPTKASPDGASK